jgi:8-oxo-dGTP pyrophosphatase MutT (NUDIX family)
MERLKLKVAVYLLLIKDNKILLLRRYNTGWNDGNYSLPAGHLDPNETVTNALLRESFEEIGVTLSSENIKLVHTMHRIASSYIDLFFVAEKWNGEITNVEPNKCDDLKWFDLCDLPPNMVLSVKSAIEKYKAGELFSDFLIDG